MKVMRGYMIKGGRENMYPHKGVDKPGGSEESVLGRCVCLSFDPS